MITFENLNLSWIIRVEIEEPFSIFFYLLRGTVRILISAACHRVGSGYSRSKEVKIVGRADIDCC